MSQNPLRPDDRAGGTEKGIVNDVLKGSDWSSPATISPPNGLRSSEARLSAGQQTRSSAGRGQRRAPFRLAHELRRRIECGLYEPGDWLPIEQTLLFEFPVSRAVLREAIIILECQGLIVSHHGLGNRVVARQRLEDKTVIQSIDALALLEACLFFEVETAALAATLASDGAPTDVSPPIDDTPLKACHRFHVGLAKAAQNRLVEISIRNLWDLALNQSVIGEALNAAFWSAAGPILSLRRDVRGAVDHGDPDLARHCAKTLFRTYIDAVLDLDEQRRLSEVQSASNQLRRSWALRLSHEKGEPECHS